MLNKWVIGSTIAFLLLALVFTYGRLSGDQTEVNIDPSKVNLYFFYGQGCPHCANEEIFLDKLEAEYEEIIIHRFETWHNDENGTLLDTIRRDLGFRSGVPVLLVGEEAIVGYGSEETTGQRIRALVNEYIVTGCNDIAAPYFTESVTASECPHSCEDEADGECQHDCGCQADVAIESNVKPESVELPFLGSISVMKIGLPLFTVLVAAADGFNPCAMWVLLFLINLLIGMQNRVKMWILGTAFIVTSAVVYFFFVFTWLQIFLFVGLVIWIRIMIATIAFASGSYHLKEYWANRDGCPVVEDEKRQRVFTRLRGLIAEKRFLIALGGIVLLAGAVNLVELVCSAGFPQAFVGVLAFSNLTTWQTYAYMLLYIFIFMLDDLFIFIVAMTTLKMKAISDKYTHWSYLVGGALMIAISFLLIFKPEWLSV